MTPRQMQSGFEYELAKHDSSAMVESDTIFYWLNQAIERLTKLKYSGSEDGKSFEQTQKRIDDLRSLISEERLYLIPGIDGLNKPYSYVAELPIDYWFTVQEETTCQFQDITGTTTINKRKGVTQCTHDTYSSQIENPYSEHKIHYEEAKPLRLISGNSVELITDGNYTVTFYYIRYIRKPLAISVNSEPCDLPEHTHSEIVTKAVNLYLESIGDSRYQTSKIEYNTNE